MQASKNHAPQHPGDNHIAGYALTGHAQRRIGARGIPTDTVEAALRFDRVSHVRGAETHVIGRKEVARYGRLDINLQGYEGIHAVCTNDQAILTVYRDLDLRGIKFSDRVQSYSHQKRRALTNAW